LEELVINALYEAFSSPEKDLATRHLLQAAREIVPLSKARAREIETMRLWVATNCRLAAEPETPELLAEAESDSLADRRVRMVDL
jgi:hypothetical protein